MTIKILQEQCNPEADYSGTDVPVIVAVAPGTITDPGPGELQTFCYTVTQVSEPFGLSHWLLGICPTITLDDIVNISVFIDDEEQTVIPVSYTHLDVYKRQVKRGVTPGLQCKLS